MKNRVVALILLPLLLIGCQHQSQRIENVRLTPAIEAAWRQHQTAIEAIDVWQIEGKVGIRTPQRGGSVSIRWQQRQAEMDIDLIAPFGQGGVRIQSQADKSVIEVAGEGRFEAPSLTDLLAAHFPYEVPIEPLLFWVRGLPAPSEKINFYGLNESGQLANLQQAGWTIEYSRYQNAGLPEKMVLQQDQIKLILVINNWSLDTDSDLN